MIEINIHHKYFRSMYEKENNAILEIKNVIEYHKTCEDSIY